VEKNGIVGERTDGEEKENNSSECRRYRRDKAQPCILFSRSDRREGCTDEHRQGAAMYTFFPSSCASNASMKEYPVNEFIELSIA
jgi:hypothetical protein